MTENKKLHAVLSPSGAHRWMTCAGSVLLEAKEPADTSDYADEGTAAHHIATLCLTTGNDPAAYAGRFVIVINGVVWAGGDAPKPPLLHGCTDEIQSVIEVDDEMVEALRVYVGSIGEYKQAHTLHVEQRVPVGKFTGEENAEGTSDAVIVLNDFTEIQVHDLKYGRGVVVSAKQNKQLMLYALGAVEKFDLVGDCERVRLVIHQPRIRDKPDEWDCTIDELMVFKKEVLLAANRCYAIQKSGVTIKGDLVPSDDACKFCKAKASCPELAQYVRDNVGADFDVLGAKGENKPDITGLVHGDSGTLSVKMGAVDLIDEWCRAIRTRVDHELRSGNKVPGWKLVQGKRGARKWKALEIVEALLKKMRLKKEEMYNFKLISPTDAEKFFKKEPKRWKLVSEHVEQPDGKLGVAPESDPRPSVDPTAKAAEDFNDNTAPGSNLV